MRIWLEWCPDHDQIKEVHVELIHPKTEVFCIK